MQWSVDETNRPGGALDPFARFYSARAKTDLDLTVFEHGSDVYHLARWICRELGIPFKPYLGLSALLHDAGKLEGEPGTRERWVHTPHSAKWIDKLRTDPRFDLLLALVAGGCEKAAWNVEKDVALAKAAAETHHGPKFALYATHPEFYVILVADALSTLVEYRYNGKVRDLLSSAEGIIDGLTLDVVNNLSTLCKNLHRSDEKLKQWLEAEIHTISLPNRSSGDIIAATICFSLLEDQFSAAGIDVVMQRGSDLLVSGSKDKLLHILASATITFKEALLKIYGEEGVIDALVGARDPTKPIDSHVNFARTRKSTKTGYFKQRATNWSPGNLKPILLTERIASEFAARYLDHTQYKPDLASMNIDIQEAQKDILQNGRSGIDRLYLKVREKILRETPEENVPISPWATREWLREKLREEKAQNPTIKIKDLSIIKAHPSIQLFLNYHVNSVSAVGLYEILDQNTAEAKTYSINLADHTSLDGLRISHERDLVSPEDGAVCSICYINRADGQGNALVIPEPQTPSAYRLYMAHKSKKWLVERVIGGNISVCDWCRFVGTLTMPLKTLVVEGRNIQHSDDTILMTMPIRDEDAIRICNALERTFLGTRKGGAEAEEEKEPVEEEASGETRSLTEEILNMLKSLPGRNPQPLVDFVSSLREKPKGYRLSPRNFLETMLGFQVFYGTISDMKRQFAPLAGGDLIYSMIELTGIVPTQILYGDPVSTETTASRLGMPEETAATDPLATRSSAPTGADELPELESPLGGRAGTQGYRPRIVFLGKPMTLDELRRLSYGFRLVKRYGWVRGSGGAWGVRWPLAEMFSTDPRSVAELLLSHTRKGSRDNRYPRPVGTDKTKELVYLTEEACEGLPKEEEFVTNAGLWMTKFLIDGRLVDRALSLIELDEGQFKKRSWEFTKPIHDGATLGSLRLWAEAVMNLSRRVAADRKKWRDRPLEEKEIHRLVSFSEALSKECKERSISEEDLLRKIDGMRQYLHFSVTHQVAKPEKIESFYVALVRKHGYEPVQEQEKQPEEEGTGG